MVRLSSGLPSPKFVLLLCVKEISAEVIHFIGDITQINSYLSKVNPYLNVEILITGNPELSATIASLCEEIPSQIVKNVFSLTYKEGLSYITTLSIDSICVNDSSLVKKLSKEKNINFTAGDTKFVREQVEIFARGHGIPWSFEFPMENMELTSLYLQCGPTVRSTYSFFVECDSHLSDLGKELLRGIIHRLTHIAYAKDLLLFFEQQNKFAKRQRWENQDFKFERDFYLNYYFMLLQAILDQVASWTNVTFNLNITNPMEIEIHNDSFLSQVKRLAPKLHSLFRSKSTTEWLTNLRPNRNYTSHRGVITLTTLLKEPENLPSRKELEREVTNTEEWKSLYLMPSDMLAEYKETAIELLKIKKYKTVKEDIAVIRSVDGQQLLSAPMQSVKWHFDHLSSFMTEFLSLVRGE